MGATSLDAGARQHGRDPKNGRRINPAFAGGRIAKARGQTLQVLVPRKSGEAPAAQSATPRITTLADAANATVINPTVAEDAPGAVAGSSANAESGRAPCGERVCQHVSISGVAGSLKKK